MNETHCPSKSGPAVTLVRIIIILWHLSAMAQTSQRAEVSLSVLSVLWESRMQATLYVHTTEMTMANTILVNRNQVSHILSRSISWGA
jgi:hypothetical protein